MPAEGSEIYVKQKKTGLFSENRVKTGQFCVYRIYFIVVCLYNKKVGIIPLKIIPTMLLILTLYKRHTRTCLLYYYIV